MKKTIISSLCIMAVLLSCVGCGTSSSSSSSKADNKSSISETKKEESKAETTKEEKAEQAKQDYSVKILSSKIGKDYAGKPILIVEYEFKHNKDKATSFAFSIEHKAFQNGVECSSSTVVSDEIDGKQAINDVKPGIAYKLKVGYALSDTKTPVEIECRDLMSFDDKAKPLASKTIKLK